MPDELFVPVMQNGEFLLRNGWSEPKVRAYRKAYTARSAVGNMSGNFKCEEIRIVRYLPEDVIDAIKVAVASHIWDQVGLDLEINAIIDRIVYEG